MLFDVLDSGWLGLVCCLVNILVLVEIGNLFELLLLGKCEVVWGLVDFEDDGEVLVYVGEDVCESLFVDMDLDEIIVVVEDLDIDDLVDLVEDLLDMVIDEVFKLMDCENCEWLEQVLFYFEDSVGCLMNLDVVIVCVDVNVDVVLCYLCLCGELLDYIDYLFVVSWWYQYFGWVLLVVLVIYEDIILINCLIDDE